MCGVEFQKIFWLPILQFYFFVPNLELLKHLLFFNHKISIEISNLFLRYLKLFEEKYCVPSPNNVSVTCLACQYNYNSLQPFTVYISKYISRIFYLQNHPRLTEKNGVFKQIC